MGKVVVKPKKKLFALLRFFFALSIFFVGYGIFQLLLGNSVIWYVALIVISFVTTLVLFNRSIKNYYSLELLDKEIKIYQLNRLVVSDQLKKFKYSHQKLEKPEGFERITIEGSGLSFSISNLEHDGFENLLKNLQKLKRLK